VTQVAQVNKVKTYTAEQTAAFEARKIAQENAKGGGGGRVPANRTLEVNPRPKCDNCQGFHFGVCKNLLMAKQ